MYADCVIALRKKIERLKKDNSGLRALVETHEELKTTLKEQLRLATIDETNALAEANDLREENERLRDRLAAAEKLVEIVRKHSSNLTWADGAYWCEALDAYDIAMKGVTKLCAWRYGRRRGGY